MARRLKLKGGASAPKCPPGFLCVTPGWSTLITALLVVGCGIVLYLILQIHTSRVQNTMTSLLEKNNASVQQELSNMRDAQQAARLSVAAQIHTQTQPPQNPMQNPFFPPERMPHNPQLLSIATRQATAQQSAFQQVGILQQGGTPGQGQVLPLFGRPVDSARGKWTYYTQTGDYTPIKIPLSNQNRPCDSEHGCDELYDRDSVKIAQFQDEFQVTMYESSFPKYNPHVL